MTRTVFANNMVAHVWAHATSDEGRSNNGNFWFDRETIYSYRTPIARLHLDMVGAKVILMTCESFSMTTEGKHKNAIHRASGYGRFIRLFSVPFIGVAGGQRRIDRSEVDHAGNVAHFESTYSAEIDRLARARTWKSTDRLERIASDAREYCLAFGLDHPAFAHIDAVAVDVSLVVEGHLLEDTPARRAAREEAGRIAAARQAEHAAARQAEQVRLWRACAVNAPLSLRDERGGALLRVRGDDLETSQGAIVPLADAVKAFEVIRAEWRGEIQIRRPMGREFTRLRVGHFSVDRIELDRIIAGCHTIYKNEVEQLATSIGIA